MCPNQGSFSTLGFEKVTQVSVKKRHKDCATRSNFKMAFKKQHRAMQQDSQARLVWIASAPDTGFRVRNTAADTGSVFKLRKCNLNRVDGLRPIEDVCEETGLNLDRWPPNSIFAVGLVYPSFAYDALKQLDKQERLQIDLFQRLHFSETSLHGKIIFFKVKRCILLPEPMLVQRVGTRKARSFFSTMQEGQLERLLESLDQSQVDQPGWLVNATKQNKAHVLVQLPTPVAALLASGVWDTFGLCDMTESLFKGWTLGACPLLWTESCLPCPKVPEPQIENIVRAETASKFAKQLQDIYSNIVGLLSQDVDGETACVMHSMAASLQQHVAGMQVAYSGDAAAVLASGREAYNIYYLLHCFLMCDLLKSDSSLEEAVRHACKIALPRSVQAMVLEMLDSNQRPMPSPATISRLRLKIDVAWMLLVRKQIHALLQHGVVLHCMVDSSPQGRHDYELLHVTLLDKQDLRQMHADICALQNLKRFSMAERVDEARREWIIMERIRKCFRELTPPPALLGMGKARSGLALKFHAAMHSLYLMAGPGPCLEAFAGSIWSWVTDHGTESGFSHIGPVGLGTLFPYILDSEGLSCQAGLLQQEIDFSMEANHEDVKGEPTISCQGSVAVPGLLRILHNCFLALGNVMQHFSEAITHLKEVAKLLSHPETKERLLSTCFIGPLGEALFEDLKNFSGQVYEERWGTVADCVLQLVRCESSLRHAWDKDKYMMSSDSAMKPGMVAVNVVDEAVKSPMFWAYLQMLATFAAMQSRMVAWCESCPCHWDVLAQEDSDIPKDLKAQWLKCPLRGKRAPEIAAGKFTDMVQEFLVQKFRTINVLHFGFFHMF